MKKLLAILVFILFSISTLLGQTNVYSDAALTNLVSSHSSIQGAIDDATTLDGYFVTVDAGTYDEIVTIDKQLSLLGPNAAISAVTGTRVAEARLLQRINITGTTAQDVTISGFEFFEVPAPSTWTIYIQGNSDDYSIQNNRFIDCEKDAIRSGISSNTANITVTGNLIQGITAPLASGILLGGINGTSVISDNEIDLAVLGVPTGYAGIQTPGATGLTISGNEISNTTNQGLQLAGASGNVVIEDNTISNTNTSNGADKGAIRLYGTDFIGPITIRNNTLTNSYNGLAVRTGEDITGKTITVEENDLSGNSNFSIYNGATSGTLDATCNWYGTEDIPTIASTISNNVDYIPFLVVDDGGSVDPSWNSSSDTFSCTGTFPVVNITQNLNYTSVQAAIDAANANDVLEIVVPDHTEPAQIIFDKNITLRGQGISVTTLRPGVDTGTSGDSRGFIIVNENITFNIEDLIIDGTGRLVWHAIRNHGEGSVSNVNFTEIKYNESGPNYRGTAVVAFGSGNVDIINSEFSEIGRIGARFFGSALTNSIFSNNTYTGKGAGDWIDYALDINNGAVVNVINNTISNNLGVASVDGSSSAGILVTTFSGPGTNVTITGNTINNNSIGIIVGFNSSDTSTVVANENDITNNGLGVISQSQEVDATNNYWGTADGPSGFANGTGDSINEDVNACPFYDAPVATGTLVGCPVRVYSDAGLTTLISSYNSIQQAIDATTTLDGYFVTVDAGTYNENLLINKQLTITGENASTTFIDGAGTTGTHLVRLNAISSGNVEVRGFTFQNAPISSNRRFLFTASGCTSPAEITIRDNIFLGAGDPTLDAADENWGLILQNSSASFNILSNTFDDIGSNSLLIERAVGDVEVNDNDFIIRGYGSAGIFSMSYQNGSDPGTVTGFHHYHANNFSVKSGTTSADSGIVSGITMASAFGSFFGQRTNGEYQNVVIEDNIINDVSDNLGRGIQLEVDGPDGGFPGVEIRNNTINSISPNAPIVNNSRGIRLLGDITNPVITENSIEGFVDGIRLQGTFSEALYPTGVVATENNLASNDNAIVNLNPSSVVDATCNWYGTEDTTVISGFINGDVSFLPYLVVNNVNGVSYSWDNTNSYSCVEDTDRDGVNDFADLDDDNDGILDAVEKDFSPFNFSNLSTSANVYTVQGVSVSQIFFPNSAGSIRTGSTDANGNLALDDEGL
jgi:parallel beta-helix repeat protein